VKNPLHQITRDNREQIRLFARELGLSPAARAGMRIEVERHNPADVDEVIGLSPRLLRVIGGREDG
jgi:phage terminase small subunit